MTLQGDLAEVIKDLRNGARTLSKFRDENGNDTRAEALARIINALENLADALENLPTSRWP